MELKIIGVRLLVVIKKWVKFTPILYLNIQIVVENIQVPHSDI